MPELISSLRKFYADKNTRKHCQKDIKRLHPRINYQDSDPTFQVVPDPYCTGMVPFTPSQINNWQILNVHNWTAARFFKHFKDFLRKYICTIIEDELDYYEE